MVVNTPSGYEVQVRDYLTFGEKRELEKLFVGAAKINPKDSKISDVDNMVIYKVQDRAFEMLVLKIIIAGVEVVEDKYKTVMSWKEEDGNAVFEAVNKIAKLDKEKTPEEIQKEKKI